VDPELKDVLEEIEDEYEAILEEDRAALLARIRSALEGE